MVSWQDARIKRVAISRRCYLQQDNCQKWVGGNYKIEYNKSKACFKKKSYYMFQPNRALRIKVHQAAKDGQLDAFEYNYWKDGSRKVR